ncbi:hypothetical protein [Saccharopolyspora sp. 5N708]|uniref:hypothetical protein n=1 Tax=Saccharopolyspora sp. 5N708 TaxID=3457424 RepID=UPI003FD33CAC
METNGTSPEQPIDRPTREEAAAALREAEQAQAALGSTPPPWWYFIAMAAMAAVAPVINFAPSTPLGIGLALLGIVVWAALFGITVGTYVRKYGVVPRLRLVPPKLVLPFAVVVAVAVIVASLLTILYDQAWAPFVASGVIAAVILIMGATARQRVRKSA